MNLGRKIFIIGLFLMPFFQGLYFYHEIFIVMCLVLIFLAILVHMQKGIYMERSLTTLFLTGLFVLYGVTCFYAIDRGMALMGALKVMLYLALYMLYTQLYTEDFKEKLLSAVIYSALVAAVIGIFAFLNPQLGELLIQNGRLGGVFQYANTYGLFCLVGILLVIRRQDKSFFEVWSIAILVFAMILTFSRSIILMGLMVIIVGILMERKHFMHHFAGLLSGGLIAFTFIKVLRLESISTRLADTSMETSEWVTRIVYYKDALKMIGKFPFGTGYMGYAYMERAYQTSSTYQVKFVHSNLLQYALDIGILGALMCCLFLLVQLFSNKMDLLLKLVFMTICLHGLIDFDFEFPYVLILMLIVIGVNSEKILYFKKLKGLQFGILLSLIGIYGYMIFPTVLAFDDDYEKAIALYPIYSEAQVKMIKKMKEQDEEGARLAETMIKRNVYCVEAFAYLRDYYYGMEVYEKAKVMAQRTIEINPLNIKHVEIYSSIRLECSQAALRDGDYITLKASLELLLEIPDYLEELAKERLTDYNVRHVPKLEMTQVLLSNDKRADQLYLELGK